MKETFPEFAVSNSGRARYNAPVHNSAVVLADEQYHRVIAGHSHPERDQAVFLTGAPGAGKTTAVLEGGEPAQDVRVIYEGQLANPETAIPKIQAAIEAGVKPTIVAIDVPPEIALQSTLARFEIEGRGASIHAIATIQSGLPDGLEHIRARFGDQVDFHLIDRTNGMNNSTELSGLEHLDRLQKGNYDQIRDRLTEALQQQFESHRISDDAYRQASGLATLAIGPAIYHEYGPRIEQLQAPDAEELSRLRIEIGNDPSTSNLPPQFDRFAGELGAVIVTDAALGATPPDTSATGSSDASNRWGENDDALSMAIE